MAGWPSLFHVCTGYRCCLNNSYKNFDKGFAIKELFFLSHIYKKPRQNLKPLNEDKDQFIVQFYLLVLRDY